MSAKFRLVIFVYKYFWIPVAIQKFNDAELLVFTHGTSDKGTTNRIIYLQQKVFGALIFGSQQTIQKY